MSITYIKYHTYLGGVKLHFGLVEDAVLRQMVMQVTSVHQVQDEAEFVGRMECVCHANDKRTVNL